MKILALETSCDDTAVAVVEDGTKVLSSVCVSQVDHNEYGGVVPEIAARLHSENWRGALEKCLSDGGLEMSDIDYFAVTNGPGLQTSLLTGTTAASTLSLLYQKPLIPVHHIYGHICSNFLERNISDFQFPALVLVSSGGHTEIHLWESFTKLQKRGATLDDAAGEAFDKIAKMLGLGYPGGPIVSREAGEGNPKAYDFPRIMLGKESLDFSFSGLKAAVYRELQNNEGMKELKNERINDQKLTTNICASFQQAVVDTFYKKASRALDKYPQIRHVHFVGGVSANIAIRESLNDLCKSRGLQFFIPMKNVYSTDNAAMIGSAAYFLVQENSEVAKIQFLDAEPRLQFMT